MVAEVLAVEPDIGILIDPVELDAHALAGLRRGESEVFAIPGGAGKGVAE